MMTAEAQQEEYLPPAERIRREREALAAVTPELREKFRLMAESAVFEGRRREEAEEELIDAGAPPSVAAELAASEWSARSNETRIVGILQLVGSSCVAFLGVAMMMGWLGNSHYPVKLTGMLIIGGAIGAFHGLFRLVAGGHGEAGGYSF